MSTDTRGIREGYHEETRQVGVLTDRVLDAPEIWVRGADLEVPSVVLISEINAEVSGAVAAYGALAERDTAEFAVFGVNIEVQDAQDARACEAPQ